MEFLVYLMKALPLLVVLLWLVLSVRICLKTFSARRFLVLWVSLGVLASIAGSFFTLYGAVVLRFLVAESFVLKGDGSFREKGQLSEYKYDYFIQVFHNDMTNFISSALVSLLIAFVSLAIVCVMKTSTFMLRKLRSTP